MFKQHYGDNDSTITKYLRWSILPTLQFILVTPCISDEVGKNPNTHNKTKTETNNKQQTTKDFHSNKQQNRNLYSKYLHKKSHKYPQIPNAQTEQDIPCDSKLKMQRERETENERETKNESESETEREIESVWESLIARLRKSEWVDSKIERVRGRLRKWVMRE